MNFDILEAIVFLAELFSCLIMYIGFDLIKKGTDNQNSKKSKLGKTLKTIGIISVTIFGVIDLILLAISFSMN